MSDRRATEKVYQVLIITASHLLIQTTVIALKNDDFIEGPIQKSFTGRNVPIIQAGNPARHAQPQQTRLIAVIAKCARIALAHDVAPRQI